MDLLHPLSLDEAQGLPSTSGPSFPDAETPLLTLNPKAQELSQVDQRVALGILTQETVRIAVCLRTQCQEQSRVDPSPRGAQGGDSLCGLTVTGTH